MFTRNGSLLELSKLIILGNDQQEIVSNSWCYYFQNETFSQSHYHFTVWYVIQSIQSKIQFKIEIFLPYLSDSLYLYFFIWMRLEANSKWPLFSVKEWNFHAFSFICCQYFSFCCWKRTPDYKLTKCNWLVVQFYPLSCGGGYNL